MSQPSGCNLGANLTHPETACTGQRAAAKGEDCGGAEAAAAGAPPGPAARCRGGDWRRLHVSCGADGAAGVVTSPPTIAALCNPRSVPVAERLWAERIGRLSNGDMRWFAGKALCILACHLVQSFGAAGVDCQGSSRNHVLCTPKCCSCRSTGSHCCWYPARSAVSSPAQLTLASSRSPTLTSLMDSCKHDHQAKPIWLNRRLLADRAAEAGTYAPNDPMCTFGAAK